MILEVKNISKNFGEKQVLKDVSFSVESGSALGLLGRNGAGKTTTIRIIMGVFSGGGEILIDSKPIDRRKVSFGYLPEEHGMYPKKTIIEQLTYFGCLRGMSTPQAKAATSKWLSRLEMSEYINSRLDTLSKGNQQKIQLACALLNNPEIVILDEPFSGLDPVNAMLLKDVVTELINNGKIVLFSSHQMNYVEEFCRNIAILNHGGIVLDGNIREIKRSYDRNTLIINSQNANAVKNAVNDNLSDFAVSTSHSGDQVRVKLKDEEMKYGFTAALASLGLDFDSIQVYEPSLNDIFVQYTED